MRTSSDVASSFALPHHAGGAADARVALPRHARLAPMNKTYRFMKAKHRRDAQGNAMPII
jgi:hypothetical protein